MMIIAHKTPLIFRSEDDERRLIEFLKASTDAWNECSKVQYLQKIIDIRTLHESFYHDFRGKNPEIPAQCVISTIRHVSATYQAVKKNGHAITKPCLKKRFSYRCDPRSYSFKNGVLSLLTLGKRAKATLYIYPKLQEAMDKYTMLCPTLSIENERIIVNLPFDIPEPTIIAKSAVGIDVGVRIAAATSEGKLYKDASYNTRKRRIRYLKSHLKSRGTKSARRKLKKISRKERNMSKAQTHLLANKILGEAKADCIVLEDLDVAKMRKKKHAFSAPKKLSQVPLGELLDVITHKAPRYGKTVIRVSPVDTSRIDHRTNVKDGIRKGRRYYGADGVVLDADINASINIARRSKLPVSHVKALDGQAVVNQPNVFKSNGASR